MNFPVRKPRPNDRGGGGYVEERLSRLEATVGHIQSDVSDIRTDLRRTNDKVDALRGEMHAGFDGLRSEMHAGVGSLRKDMYEKFEALKDSLSSAKIWALLLYIALAASLLGTLAHGFGWI